jgi:hypothetical protein
MYAKLRFGRLGLKTNVRDPVPTYARQMGSIFLTVGLDLMFLLCSIQIMTDRPASWRFPTTKQIQKLADAPIVAKNEPPTPAVGPTDDLPAAYWASLLGDARADAVRTEKPIEAQKLFEIGRHVLRVSCSRCERIVEIQKADATRFYGADATWREVGQRLLNNTCTARTGRHEEDGCWASFE